ncbi:hypothetical protein HQ393_12585 [Chitinibacter bivalviorum]|uniref:Uncharacterized protein n=1 Tax=Chitinibacter bivalviorum TaxID=2739434 RepID=A0A7H9BJY8_9NEIS|nr:hypothetical protein [Chitinibacter bivalviorum]QLG89007.1 hypothetical protein HQ393_12585 [Chitinibacter bivalviorum]
MKLAKKISLILLAITVLLIGAAYHMRQDVLDTPLSYFGGSQSTKIKAKLVLTEAELAQIKVYGADKNDNFEKYMRIMNGVKLREVIQGS